MTTTYSSVASTMSLPNMSSAIILQTALQPPKNERFIQAAHDIRMKYPLCFVGVMTRKLPDNSKLSVDDITKKRFTGILNKMTASNIDRLCSMVEELEIKTLGDDVLIELLWKAVGNHGGTYCDQLCQVAKMIDPNAESHLWTHKRDYCLAGYRDCMSDGNYDDFCDYSVMSKRYVNHVSFLVKMRLLDGHEVLRMCGTHLVDITEHEDSLLVYIRVINMIDIPVQEKIKTCNDVLKSRGTNIPNKIKFKIMDIIGI